MKALNMTEMVMLEIDTKLLKDEEASLSRDILKSKIRMALMKMTTLPLNLTKALTKMSLAVK